MSTAITKITPDEKRIYDFRPDYVKKQINLIKKTFSKRCLEDNRLSDEYKAYVKNTDNIFVKFIPVYGFDCKLSLSSIYADVSYSYRNTYVSSTTVSGTASVNSSGDVNISNVHSTDHYSSERVTTTTNAHWWSSATTSCVTHIGTAAYSEYDLSNYEDITDNKNIPSELNKIAGAPITYDFLNQYLTPSCLPSSVYNSLVKNGLGSHENDSPKNIRIDRITDYHIDELWITYLPYTYEFDVWCEFEGEIYQRHCKSLSEIASIGQMSNHYEKYEEILSHQHYTFAKRLKIVRVLYTFSIILAALATLGLISLLIFGKQLHVEGLRYFYLFPTIALCIGALVTTVIGIVIAKKRRPFHVKDRDYDPSKTLDALAIRLREKAEQQRRQYITRASLFLSIILFILGGIGTGAYFMCKNVYAEHFLYTPEIIGTYYSYENGVFNKLCILSCDSEGMVEAISESTYQQYYAKSKEVGEIIRKNQDGLQIKFTLSEALYQPSQGNFDELSYATFSSDYCEITDYCDTPMIREENWKEQGHLTGNHQETQLGTYFLYTKNTAHALTIHSMDHNDGVSFTMTTISGTTFNETKGTGKILIVNPDNSCFVDFQTETGPLVGYISTDGQTITTDVEYAKNKGNIVYINSVNDLLSINDTNANPRLFVLMNDLDFQGRSISFISTLSGIFYGNGHTIKNFVVSSGFNSSAGLFGTVYENAVICDLMIENGSVNTTKDLKYAGLLCGYLYGTLTHVTATGSVHAPNADNVGELAGKSNSTGKITACTPMVSINS